jgi:hypothetical protein
MQKRENGNPLKLRLKHSGEIEVFSVAPFVKYLIQFLINTLPNS